MKSVAWYLVKNGFQGSVSLMSEMGYNFINFVLVGRLDAFSIAALGLGTITMHALVMSFDYGLNGAIDTYVSLAFGGK